MSRTMKRDLPGITKKPKNLKHNEVNELGYNDMDKPKMRKPKRKGAM